MIELFSSAETWISLLTLTVMEIVLGIDNVIFISIVTGKLPVEQQQRARGIGIALALIIRILLLLIISWIIGLTQPVFTVLENEFSWRDIILFAGGLFLLAKSTMEIHHNMDDQESHDKPKKVHGFMNVVFQVILLDIVFSFDSIITAVGLAKHVEIMIVAVVISMIVMFIFSRPISDFIHRNPTMKMLALSFLLMIGLTLIVEAFEVHVPKNYVYFAMAFSLFVETLNIRMNRKRKKKPDA